MTKQPGVVEECEDIARDALMVVCRPLLMDGDGWFYAKNGNSIPRADVLKEHQKMRVALETIKERLAREPRPAA